MDNAYSRQLRRDVRRFVASLGPVDEAEIRDDVSLIDQGAIDSLGVVELQLFIETRLGREIEPAELGDDTLLTVDAVVDWLAPRAAAPATAET